MQLPVYMNAAVSFLQERYPQTTIIPAAMLYYRLQKPIIEIEGTKAEEEIEAEIRKQMKPDRLLLGEDCVLTMLDQGFTTDSDVMRVGRKKDGSFKADFAGDFTGRSRAFAFLHAEKGGTDDAADGRRRDRGNTVENRKSYKL